MLFINYLGSKGKFPKENLDYHMWHIEKGESTVIVEKKREGLKGKKPGWEEVLPKVVDELPKDTVEGFH